LTEDQPDVARLQKALIRTLSNMRHYDEAIMKPFTISNGSKTRRYSTRSKVAHGRGYPISGRWICGMKKLADIDCLSQ